MKLRELLRVCEDEDKIVVELFCNVGDQPGRQNIIRSLHQATIVYVPGRGAVEKHPAGPFLGVSEVLCWTVQCWLEGNDLHSSQGPMTSATPDRS